MHHLACEGSCSECSSNYRCESCGLAIADDEPRIYFFDICDVPFCGDCGREIIETRKGDDK